MRETRRAFFRKVIASVVATSGARVGTPYHAPAMNGTWQGLTRATTPYWTGQIANTASVPMTKAVRDAYDNLLK